MDSPLVTIIVPLYNSADTISRCVESIKAQTIADWELILAVNASTDASLDVCRQFSLSDHRINVISVAAKGVSYARNAAIDIALGKYICFVDSDDVIEPNYLTKLIEDKTPQLSVCGYFLDSIDGHGNISQVGIRQPNSISWDRTQPKQVLVNAFENGYFHFCWNKLFLTSIIKDNNIRFDLMPVNEDYIFVLKYLQYTNRINIISDALYHWIRPSNRLTGVNSIPDNLIDIYNESQMLTRKFFQADAVADKIAYFTYEMIIYKYYQAFSEGRFSKKKLSECLNSFHRNELVKAAYNAYSPTGKAEKIFYLLAKFGLFRLHYLLTQKIIKKI